MAGQEDHFSDLPLGLGQTWMSTCERFAFQTVAGACPQDGLWSPSCSIARAPQVKKGVCYHSRKSFGA